MGPWARSCQPCRCLVCGLGAAGQVCCCSLHQQAFCEGGGVFKNYFWCRKKSKERVNTRSSKFLSPPVSPTSCYHASISLSPGLVIKEKKGRAWKGGLENITVAGLMFSPGGFRPAGEGNFFFFPVALQRKALLSKPCERERFGCRCVQKRRCAEPRGFPPALCRVQSSAKAQEGLLPPWLSSPAASSPPQSPPCSPGPGCSGSPPWCHRLSPSGPPAAGRGAR